MASKPEPPVEPTSDPDLLEGLLAPVIDLDGEAQLRALEALCAAQPALAERLRRRYAVLVRFGLASEHGAAAGHPMISECAPPVQLGPFRIVRTLGRGGMGVVYLAEAPDSGGLVAVKVIRPEFLPSERVRQRFQREVAIAAKLDHPGLCTVHGSGEVDGQPYLVLRYVEGESLEQRLQLARAGRHGVLGGGGRASSPRAGELGPALRLVESVARALHVAHDAGLVHRDIKPGNVMVGSDGVPVVMDFGLARDTDSSAADLTQSTDALGTPAYMAPEQVRGAPVDRRTDVHALGALLYECLTLRPPYEGRSREDLFRRILAEQPIELRRLQPAASREVATVVHRCLAKEPAHRYPTALALAEDLAALVEGRPTVARPPGLLARAWGWAGQHRTTAAVAAALLVGLVGSLAMLGRSLRAERQSRAVALVTRAASLREDPQLEFEVLREALRTSPEPEVVAALNAVLPELQEWQLVRRAEARIEAITPSPRRKWFLVSGQRIPAALHRDDGTFWQELWRVMPQRPAVSFSPDEDELLLCRPPERDEDRVLRIVRCDLRGERVQVRPFADVPPLPGTTQAGTATSLAQDGRGRVAVTCILPGTGRAGAVLHDSSGTRLRSFPLPDRAHGCAFLPDGRLVLASGIWDESGRCTPFELAHGGAWPAEVKYVLVVGHRVAIVSTAGVEMFGFDGARRYRLLRGVSERGQAVSHAETAGDGALLITFNDGLIWCLDADLVHQHWQEAGSVPAARFQPPGDRIVAGDWRGRITVRDRSGNLLHAWQGHQHGTHCAPLADGQRILSGSWDMTVKVWTPGSSPGLPHRSGFPRLALLRVGDLVVAASTDGRLHAFDAAGGIVATAQVSPLVLRLYAHRDARSVWVSEQDGRRLWVWTPALGELRGPVQLATEADAGSESFAHLACDRLLMASGWSRRLHWFDAQGGSVGPPGSKTMRASHVAAAPGGQVAVTVDGSGAIGLLDGAGTWLWEGFEPEAREEAATAFATCLQLSDDGRLLLIGRDDGSVSLWDLGARRRIGHWRDHRQRVRALAIDAAGRRFSSCCSVGHLIVREIGREVPLLEWHSTGETFESVAFAGPDAIVTGGWRRSGRLRWWWWDPEVLRQKVEAMPVMPLGPEQARLLTETLARR